MASRRTCTRNRAFTLIEVVVALSIFACLIGVVAVGPDLYRGYTTRDARTTLLTALMHARAQAIDAVCLSEECTSAQAHGVHIDAPLGRLTDAVLFEGSTYDPNDTTNTSIDFNHISQRIFYTGPTEISFAALSGDAAPATLALSDGNATSTITVGSEGQLAWTH